MQQIIPGVEAARFPTAPSFVMGRRTAAWLLGGPVSILESLGERRPTWKALNCQSLKSSRNAF